MTSLAVNVGNTLDPGSPYSQLLMISGVKSGSTTAPTISSPSGMNTTATALSNGTTKVSVQTADQLLSTLGKPGAKTFTYNPLSFPTGIGLIFNPVAAKTQRYVYTGASESPAATLSAANVLIEKTYGLVGGTLCTDRTPSGGTKTFSYTGLGGSVVATRDSAGAATRVGFLAVGGNTRRAYGQVSGHKVRIALVSHEGPRDVVVDNTFSIWGPPVVAGLVAGVVVVAVDET